MRLVLPAKDAASTPAPRGTALIVVPTTSYGARHDYYWEDIVATGQLLLAGKIKTTHLRKTTSRWAVIGGGRKFRVMGLMNSGCFTISQGPKQYQKVIGIPRT